MANKLSCCVNDSIAYKEGELLDMFRRNNFFALYFKLRLVYYTKLKKYLINLKLL